VDLNCKKDVKKICCRLRWRWQHLYYELND